MRLVSILRIRSLTVSSMSLTCVFVCVRVLRSESQHRAVHRQVIDMQCHSGLPHCVHQTRHHVLRGKQRLTIVMMIMMMAMVKKYV